MSRRREWRSRANCLGTDPELFFPAAEHGPVYEVQVAAAKAVCEQCPVRAECLAEALVRLPYGIAGGLTAEERRIGRPRRRVVPRPGRRPSRQRAVGLTLLAAGRPVRDVARCCGVSERTAQRWAAAADPPDRQGEESHGGNRALLQISPTPNPLAGTRTQEGLEL
jgi:WhiB family transcriptional regulator, redox-sensing transcriptional regulator